MKALPVAEAKRDFSAVLDAAQRGEETVVLRHGKPVAVIAPVTPTGRRPLPKPRRPGGLLALAGLFADWETMEEDMAAVVAARPAPRKLARLTGP
jgi:prevent-host-death family protein